MSKGDSAVRSVPGHERLLERGLAGDLDAVYSHLVENDPGVRGDPCGRLAEAEAVWRDAHATLRQVRNEGELLRCFVPVCVRGERDISELSMTRLKQCRAERDRQRSPCCRDRRYSSCYRALIRLAAV